MPCALSKTRRPSFFLSDDTYMALNLRRALGEGKAGKQKVDLISLSPSPSDTLSYFCKSDIS